ncbi:hypothetical protein HNQ94_003841 [Salirhabdus euzebyi]|uniref:Oxidoreductase n=1 Tax=Salirhabdus euzebyi TaxID=394506 RepID=A0A841QA01_9BACI|nr:SDR family oxidoreductase [Salirhabdus euzebyi]MBB6455341.1 hypothetical protein [Salirhabdus euzebyi]
MKDRLVNKRIVITGASSGIGQQLAYEVAKAGAIPILVARSHSKLEEIVAHITEQFDRTSDYYVCDIGNKQQWQKTMEKIVQDHKQIHVLLNNAGFGLFQNVADMDVVDIEKMFSVNVHALMQSSHFFLTHMLAHGEGHIVNIASQAAKMATPKAAVYAATKHAVLGFTNGLRMEVEAEGIYVTAVNLGPVRTNFFQTADPGGNYEKALGRLLLDPKDVAEKVIRNLYKTKREINLPLWMELGSRFYRLFPGLTEKLFKKQFSKK